MGPAPARSAEPQPEQAVASPDERARAILGAVADGTPSLNEPGLYLLLGRVAEGGGDVSEAPAVDVAALLDEPRRYRGQPIALELRVWQVSRWVGLPSTPDWPGRAVYYLAGSAQPGGEPLIVLLTDPPLGLDVGAHPQGPTFHLTGLFYKTVLRQPASEPDAPPRPYPVVVARTVTPADVGAARTLSQPWALAAIVGLMGVLLLGLRRRLSRAARPGGLNLAIRSRPSPPAPAEGLAIDPDLAREARDYHARRRAKDSQT